MKKPQILIIFQKGEETKEVDLGKISIFDLARVSRRIRELEKLKSEGWILKDIIGENDFAVTMLRSQLMDLKDK